MGDNGYEYNNNNDPTAGMTEEEIAALVAQQEANVAESDRAYRQRQLNAERRREVSSRIGRFLARQPGSRRLIARARGTINSRRRAEERNQRIRNMVRAARAEYKRNVNNAANAAFAPNAFYNDLLRQAQQEEAAGNINAVASILEQVEQARIGKSSFKAEAIRRIASAMQNSARAENARIYANTRSVLESEAPIHRQTVLKIAALDDLMLAEKKKLKLAANNPSASRAAARLYNIEQLKEELDTARHASRVPTPEQNARYQALIEGVDFGGLNSSLYPRLVRNNAALTVKNRAATKIQTAARGRQARKKLRTLKNSAALARAAAEYEASLAGVPQIVPGMVAMPSQPAAAGAPATPAPTAAERAAARAARLARFGK